MLGYSIPSIFSFILNPANFIKEPVRVKITQKVIFFRFDFDIGKGVRKKALEYDRPNRCCRNKELGKHSSKGFFEVPGVLIIATFHNNF